MARDHMPIQIGLPPEMAWEIAQPAPISYIAFIVGDEMPDPGAAFIAAGESFGVAPQDAEPLPIEDDRVAWAFAFSLPMRSARVMMWCEQAVDGASPDGQASDAKWVIFIETLLAAERPVDDAVALAATVARSGGGRTKLVFDPGLGVAWARADIDALFLGESMYGRGALVDERHLYRIELVARDRARGPYWIATIGLARVGKPEIEMLEVPIDQVRAALELVDALAARFVTEPMPYAGVPFEAGPDVRLALVPVGEAIETLGLNCAGDANDRRGLAPGPRAAICAAGKRGSFRQIWVTPTDELARLARNETGLFLAPRVTEARERIARRGWSAFMRAHAEHGANPTAAFLVKIARGEGDGAREHLWISVETATGAGGRGHLSIAGEPPARIDFALGDIGDWRIVGLRADLPEVGPESVGLLT
jgi:hypothetical protein